MAPEKTLEMELLLRALAPVTVEADATVVPLSVRVRSQLKLSSGGETCSVALSAGNIHWVTRLDREGGVEGIAFRLSELGTEGRRSDDSLDGIVRELADEGVSLDAGE